VEDLELRDDGSSSLKLMPGSTKEGAVPKKLSFGDSTSTGKESRVVPVVGQGDLLGPVGEKEQAHGIRDGGEKENNQQVCGQVEDTGLAGMEVDGMAGLQAGDEVGKGSFLADQSKEEVPDQVLEEGQKPKGKRTSTFKRRPRDREAAKEGNISLPSGSRKRVNEGDNIDDESQKRAKIQDVMVGVETEENQSLMAGLPGQPGWSQ